MYQECTKNGGIFGGSIRQIPPNIPPKRQVQSAYSSIEWTLGSKKDSLSAYIDSAGSLFAINKDVFIMCFDEQKRLYEGDFATLMHTWQYIFESILHNANYTNFLQLRNEISHSLFKNFKRDFVYARPKRPGIYIVYIDGLRDEKLKSSTISREIIRPNGKEALRPFYIGQTSDLYRRIKDSLVGESHHLSNSFPAELWDELYIVDIEVIGDEYNRIYKIIENERGKSYDKIAMRTLENIELVLFEEFKPYYNSIKRNSGVFVEKQNRISDYTCRDKCKKLIEEIDALQCNKQTRYGIVLRPKELFISRLNEITNSALNSHEKKSLIDLREKFIALLKDQITETPCIETDIAF